MNSFSQPQTGLPTALQDLLAGLVVFLVALPLCLGIALASGAPLFSGLVAGILGGVVVGWLSGSHTSVSGPAAGLTAIVAMQINELGSFEAFLLAVVIAGVVQIGMGLAQAGGLAKFVPSSVINGLLAAIGVILILKQIPHLLGHDTDPEGEMSFAQPDQETTISELLTLFNGEIHVGAILLGFLSVAILLTWNRVKWLKKQPIPAQLVVVVVGVLGNRFLTSLGGPWVIEESHLVQVPVVDSPNGLLGLLQFPDFSFWDNPAVYLAALTIAIVASLETLLNLEAVDRLDPQQRTSPPNRELLAQGVGNMLSGLVGGLPMTSVIVRSSVNIGVGAKTRFSAIWHGFFLLGSIAFLPVYLNMIPLCSLAAILIVTGMKLASPTLFREMWQGGRYQFIPFLITLLAIVFTDLLIGILVGLAISTAFILNSNLRSPVRTIREKHLGGEVLRIALANQVSFLNRASLEQSLQTAPKGTHLLLDGSNTDYIDPDILGLLRQFKKRTALAHGVEVSFYGFRPKYGLQDDTRYTQHATKELQQLLMPEDVLEILREGNQRFTSGQRLSRNLPQQVAATSTGQHPLACVLSCIDSRAPVETILDLGLGDIFSIRVAGNVTSDDVLGSMEYACAVAGAKLVLVLGHTRCGAVTSTVQSHAAGIDIGRSTGCEHLIHIIDEIHYSLVPPPSNTTTEEGFIEAVAKRNVMHSVAKIITKSRAIRGLVEKERVAVVGGMYDVSTGHVDFYARDGRGLSAEFAKRFEHSVQANWRPMII